MQDSVSPPRADVHQRRLTAQLRLRRRYAIALGIFIAAITVSAIVSAVRNHQRAEQVHTYQAVQRELATLVLPYAIQRKPSSTCAEPLCAYTRLTLHRSCRC